MSCTREPESRKDLAASYTRRQKDWPGGSVFKEILVTLDGSKYGERALRYARDLSGLAGSHVSLVTVVQLPDGDSDETASVSSRTERYAKYLSEKAAELREAGVKNVDTHVLRGEPASGITDLARETAADLVVMSTHGVGANGRHALGSVALKVLMTAPCPVFLVRIIELTPPRSLAEERWQDEGGANVG